MVSHPRRVQGVGYPSPLAGEEGAHCEKQWEGEGAAAAVGCGDKHLTLPASRVPSLSRKGRGRYFGRAPRKPRSLPLECPFMSSSPNTAELDKLKSCIQALRAKTIDNGCTEDEALSAAAKVAELLDRYDLSLTDVEIREAPCERRVFETHRKKRIPLDDCIGAVANFCDCRVWREKNEAGESRYVFFGLRSDIEVAHYLTELIDNAVRSDLGRYKNSAAYRRFRHQDRHMANASFNLGMVASIADKLRA